MKSKFLSQVYNSVLEKPRSDLLNKKIKKTVFDYVTTYSPHSHIVKSIFMKHWHN